MSKSTRCAMCQNCMCLTENNDARFDNISMNDNIGKGMYSFICTQQEGENGEALNLTKKLLNKRLDVVEKLAPEVDGSSFYTFNDEKYTKLTTSYEMMNQALWEEHEEECPYYFPKRQYRDTQGDYRNTIEDFSHPYLELKKEKDLLYSPYLDKTNAYNEGELDIMYINSFIKPEYHLCDQHRKDSIYDHLMIMDTTVANPKYHKVWKFNPEKFQLPPSAEIRPRPEKKQRNIKIEYSIKALAGIKASYIRRMDNGIFAKFKGKTFVCLNYANDYYKLNDFDEVANLNNIGSSSIISSIKKNGVIWLVTKFNNYNYSWKEVQNIDLLMPLQGSKENYLDIYGEEIVSEQTIINDIALSGDEDYEYNELTTTSLNTSLYKDKCVACKLEGDNDCCNCQVYELKVEIYENISQEIIPCQDCKNCNRCSKQLKQGYGVAEGGQIKKFTGLQAQELVKEHHAKVAKTKLDKLGYQISNEELEQILKDRGCIFVIIGDTVKFKGGHVFSRKQVENYLLNNGKLRTTHIKVITEYLNTEPCVLCDCKSLHHVKIEVNDILVNVCSQCKTLATNKYGDFRKVVSQVLSSAKA